ncbi:MAG: type II toxin-antitoxin system PemK/MazF family toxin [Anaerolineaceae bacterium]|nr:type II toxin-antitoxin system PemK/MazF family toxin [Anaerolineaceae bacterium]
MPEARQLNPKRGEIWTFRFYPQVGAEITKIRPAVVMSMDNINALGLRIIVPFTTGHVGFEGDFLKVKIFADEENRLTQDTWADVFQIKSQSIERFGKRIGLLNHAQMEQIADAVAICVGFSPSTR